jgi:hypothetical protein
MAAPTKPEPESPIIDWFSRHGVKALFALILVELAFHAWAVSQAKRREAEDAGRPGKPAVTSRPMPS